MRLAYQFQGQTVKGQGYRRVGIYHTACFVLFLYVK